MFISSKERFLNDFILPISKVVDSAVLKIEPGKITTLIATSDNTIIVSAVYNDSKIAITKTLNVPDLKKFCRILQCIEETELEFTINTNNIQYSAPGIRFKYHLYDDNIISLPKINIEKLKTLNYDGRFSLTNQSITALIRGSVIATDTNKLYLSTKGVDVFGDLTDLTRANTDSYGLKLAVDYNGTQIAKPISLNFEIFRIISCMKFKSISAQLVSAMGVLVFDTTLESSQLKFVISALEN